MYVGRVLRRVEIPVGDRAITRGGKIDLYTHDSRFDGLAEEFLPRLRVSRLPAIDPNPDLYVQGFSIGADGSDCGPGIFPPGPPLIDEVILESKLAGPVHPLFLVLLTGIPDRQEDQKQWVD